MGMIFLYVKPPVFKAGLQQIESIKMLDRKCSFAPEFRRLTLGTAQIIMPTSPQTGRSLESTATQHTPLKYEPNAHAKENFMETTSRPPLDFRVMNSHKSTSSGLISGAITSPMAVSFREEKLALQMTGLNDPGQRNGTTPAVSERGRG